MRSIGMSLLLLALVVNAPDAFAQAQAVQPAEKHMDSAASSTPNEVEQLRQEVAAQRQMIDDLQATVQRLVQSDTARDVYLDAAAGGEKLVPAALGQTTATTENRPPEKKEKAPDSLEFSVGGGKVQFYGHFDLSYDYVDNGISPAMEAASGSAALLGSGAAAVARANNGWLGQVSSNLSYFGIRGSRPINSYLTGVFQLETEANLAGTPGPTSDMQCRFCLGSRDSFVGVQGPWGAVKIGKEDAPYKKASSPLDPFIYTIGDSRSIMGNSGGDNRAEFMTRLPHSIWYETPALKGALKGFSASVLFSPGQNRSSDNSAYARGEPNCSGGNGAFVLSLQNSPNVTEGAELAALAAAAGIPIDNPCNDGSWGNIVSTAVSYRGHGLYVFGAYEHHADVNRTVDFTAPGGGVADEAAWKGGIQYALKKTGTTGNFIYEVLKRYAPADPLLNERSRPLATWAAITQKLGSKDELSVGWAHADNTPGDPGLDARPNNASNLYDIGFKHRFTSKMSSYFVYARQANHVDAHYDLGAVGHGTVVDKRDFLGTGIAGTRLQGVSGGMTYDF